MLDKITDSLVEALAQAGFDAGRAWPGQPAQDSGVYIRLAIASARQSEAGFSRFLGLKTKDDGSLLEVYGMKCHIGLRLDIYAGPEQENAAAQCEKAMDGIMQALAQYGGLSISSVACDGAAYDRDTGLFLCPCKAEATAELCFEAEEEAGQFTDFILKGELRK